MIGKTISHFRILERIGTGGMGEIYRARDTRLQRTVAIKLLSEELTGNTEARQRFIQEARAASSLDHPNICTIYEVDEIGGGQIFISMACYEGETLKQRMSRGPIPLTEALEIVTQVCRGLAKAHEAGIVHRDIKPANIMITADGVVKILDFGLAKLSGRIKVTRTGTTLGTVAYLSPEQAQGRPVDRRADIWSLGVVLYEMISSHLPFKGDSEWSMMRAIVDDRPEPVHSYCANVTPEIVHIMDHCLAKSPAERYSSCEEMLVDLARIQGERIQVIKVKRKLNPHKWLRRRVLVPLLLLAVLFIALLLFLFKPEPAPLMRTVPIATSEGGGYSGPRFSPDGRQIAYCWVDPNKVDNYDIYIQLLGTSTPNRLTSHLGVDMEPAWSPDGSHIAFIRLTSNDFKFYRLAARWGGIAPGMVTQVTQDEIGIFIMTALGHEERKVHALDKALFLDEIGVCLDWSPDGQWLAYNDRDSLSGTKNITLLSTVTREKRQLSSPPQGIQGDILQRFSPDGRYMAFVRYTATACNDLYVISVADGKEKRLTSDQRNIIGLDWTMDGHEIIFNSDRGGISKLWRISRRGGQPKLLAAGIRQSANVAVSRTENKLVFVEERGDNTIWKCAMPEKGKSAPVPRPFISSTEADCKASFSPDGSRIVFQSTRSGCAEVWTCDAEGQNPVQLTSFNGPVTDNPRWSPDGKLIAFDSRLYGHSDIFTITIEGGPPKRITDDPATDQIPTWSRDSRWLYFTSNRTGEYQLFKVSAQGGEAVQISAHGGWYASESADRKWLYYFPEYMYISPTFLIMSMEDGSTRPFTGVKADALGCFFMDDGFFYVAIKLDELRAPFGFYEWESVVNTELMDINNILNGNFTAVAPDKSCFLLHDVTGMSSMFLVENYQ